MNVGDGGGVKVGVSGCLVFVGVGGTGVSVDCRAGGSVVDFTVGVSEAYFMVLVVVIPIIVGEALAVGVLLWLGVMLPSRVTACVGVMDRVTNKTASQGETPDKPWLYASSKINSCLP